MRKIENLQQEEFKILCQFRDYCNAHGLKYYLEGGTLLGAVRHKGFIPWDDDIDTIMPRDDYNKLIELTKKEPIAPNLEIITRDSGTNFRYPYMKICNKDTVVYENDVLQENGVFIDVFPIDGAGNSIKLFKVRYAIMDYIKILENYAWMDEKDAKKLGFFKRLRMKICKGLGTQFWRNWLDRIFMKYKFGSTEYVSQIAWSTILVYCKTEEYVNQIEVDFEGEKFAAPSCYDQRLTMMYGNYMELPPVEKRQLKHLISAFWKD